MIRLDLSRSALASLACALTLSACAPLPRALPDAAKPQLPDQWSVQAVDGKQDVQPRWWTQFGDTQLNALVERALANNNDVLIAIARVDEARANWALADSARGPNLNATAAAQAGRSLGAFGPTHTRSVQPGLQASWEPDLWGRLSESSKAAEARFSASQADRDAVALSVATATTQSYIGLIALQEQLKITQSTVDSRAKAVQLARDQVRVGYISQLQLTQAESELQSVLQQIQQLQWAVQKQSNALHVLLGESDARLQTTSAQRLDELSLPAVPNSLPSQLLERRADIARAAFLLAASDHQLAAQRATFLPQVSLSANIGSLLINALDYNPLSVWSLGGSLLAPLYNSGRLDAQYDAATAQRNQAAFAYRGTVLNAFSDVENALTGTQRLAQQMEHAVKRREVLEKSLGFAHDRYEAGYASYLEELDAQRNLLQAQLEVVRLRQSELENRLALYKALGGGWKKDQGNVD